MSRRESRQNAVQAVDHAEVAEFMVTSLDGTIHPALLATPGSGIIVNAEGPSADPECLSEDVLGNLAEIYESCIEAQKEFIGIANKQRRKLRQPEFAVMVPHRWSDVSEAVVSSCNELERMTEVTDKSVPGSLGKLKSRFRKLCTHIEKGETFVSLIPDDALGCGSTLRGALGIIFSALKGTETHRKEVYDTLEELPFILTDRVANIKWFGHDEELHQRTAALFESIFRLLKHILSWLIKGTFGTGLKTLANPTGLTSGLLALRKEVHVKAERFRSHAAKLMAAFQINFDQFALVHQEKKFSQIGAMLLGMEENSQASRSQIMSVLAEVAARGQALEALIPLLVSSHEASRSIIQPTATPARVSCHADSNLLKATRRILETQPQPQLESTRKKLDCSDMVNEILEEYAYNVDLLRDDIDYLIGVISRPGRRVVDYDRLSAILSSSILSAWALVDEPSLLLIHGRTIPQPESAVSLASAQIVSQMLRSREVSRKPWNDETFIIPIAFFCGQHRRRDVVSSSNKVILNLILQLLDRGRYVFSEEAVQLCRQDMGGGDVSDFLLAFENLVTSLPADIFVIVVVDGIDFFSRTAKDREETRSIIACLVDLQRQGHIDATLKVLFTSATRPQFVEDLFDGDEVLNLPRSIAFRHLNSKSNWDFLTSPVNPDNGVEHME
ncbi:hypothetical protein N0V93_007853 [Gnomoniopsis smithogilvyi]|uniref:Uncharacterized protein n=1 Tax=Gnomoniopsis smithogilvyi TaxID=1191159 RepID=A0A9W8YKM4_9PEZI|nr:hypothetical protein N0V93_007853 [Gnomoniopsis smithogilvyi]